MKRCVGWIALLSWLALPCLWWQSRQLVPRATVLQHIDRGGRQFFSDDGRLFVCGDREHIRVYDVIAGAHVATWARSIFAVGDGLRYADGRALVALRTDEGVEVFDLMSGKTAAEFATGPGSPVRVHLAPNGRIVATDHDNRTVRLWDVQTAQLVAQADFPTISNVFFSPDSKELAVAQFGAGPVHLMELSTGRVTVSANSMNRPIVTAHYARDGRLLGFVVPSADEITLWDLTNDKLLVCCPRASWGLMGDGAFLCVRSSAVKPLYSFADRVGAARAMHLLLGLGWERQFIDIRTGRVVAHAPDGAVVEMFADGKTLATFDENGVRLWDVPPSTRLHPALPWATLGMAIALSSWWWRRRRQARTRGTAATAPTPS